MINNMKEVTDYLKTRGMTYLICVDNHGIVETWASPEINPIRARIEDD